LAPLSARGPAANRGASKQRDNADVYLVMRLGGRRVKCLIDSGCEISMVPHCLVSNLPSVHVVHAEEKITAANGTTITILGRTVLPFRLNGNLIETSVLVSNDIEEPMLGSDWLTEHDCVWDFKSKQILVDGKKAVTRPRRGPLWCRRVYLQHDVVIPPKRQVDVTVRSPLVYIGPQTTVSHAVDSNPVCKGVCVARTLISPGISNLRVRMVNTSPQPRLVRGGTCINHSESVQTLTDDTSSIPVMSDVIASTGRDELDDLKDSLPVELNSSQRNQACSLLDTYRDVFSMNEYDIGKTDLVHHRIETGNHRPIRQPLRRHPIAHLEEIDHQVDEMLRHDITEPAASSWSSNVVLVRKKDGSYRFCVDYRSLNSITYQDSYPLPHIDTCLNVLQDSSFFSTLDLRSGYHNIPIADDDKDKTAFVTRRGCWRYKVMPFGLTCAPSVFQRLMDLVLCGLSYDSCMVYLDDVIVFSADFETHLQRLQTVFERLRAAKLKLKPSKCCLRRRRVAFLGHVVSGNGVEMQAEKLAAVRD